MLKLDISHLKACDCFAECCYQRCEIASTDDWVLLALLWDDCATEIHDHDESECGFAVLEGILEETRYAISARSPNDDCSRALQGQATTKPSIALQLFRANGR